MRIDITEATKLRQEGFSYEDIAFKIGCSKAWCAKHLKGIGKGRATTQKLSSSELRDKTLSILEAAIKDIKAL